MFTQLARFERFIADQPSFYESLETGYAAVFSENPLAELQKKALVCLVAAAYQYFGFVVFGPLGRGLLAKGIARTIGADLKRIEDYVEGVTYSLLDDFNILQIVDGEPNWAEIDEAFALDFWKRLFASDSSEDEALGLNLLDLKFLRQMRSCAERAVGSFLHGADTAQVRAHLPADLDSSLSRAFECCVSAAAADSMRLFFWRIESFSKFKETRQEFKFLVKDTAQISESSLQKTAALLILLSDLTFENGAPFFPEAPVSALCLAETLKACRAVDGAALSLEILQEWLSPHRTEIAEISQGLVFAAELGLVFKISPKPGKLEFGLTSLGQTILRPFRGLLVEVLCGTASDRQQFKHDDTEPVRNSKGVRKIRVSRVNEKPKKSVAKSNLKSSERKDSESAAEGFLSAIQAHVQSFGAGNKKNFSEDGLRENPLRPLKEKRSGRNGKAQ